MPTFRHKNVERLSCHFHIAILCFTYNILTPEYFFDQTKEINITVKISCLAERLFVNDSQQLFQSLVKR